MFKPTSQEEIIALDIFRVLRHMKRKFSLAAEQHELSFGQLQALLSIKFGKSSMRDIADDLCIAFPTATVMIDKLVQEEYMERIHDTQDRRVVRLTLTEKGKAALKKSFHHRMKSVHTLLSTLSLEDKNDLQRIMQHISVTLNKEDKYGK